MNIHHLTLASVMYAIANNGLLPEMASDPETGDGGGNYCPCYWFRGYWRDRFQQEYGVARDMFYSPCNDKWNRDDFYHFDSNWCVADYFCFGRYDLLESESLRSGLVEAPSDITARSMFPRRLGQESHYDMVWTDLNRQWPVGYWVTPCVVFLCRSGIKKVPGIVSMGLPVSHAGSRSRCARREVAKTEGLGRLSSPNDLRIGVVPEPTSMAALGLAATGLLRRRRR